MSSKSDAFILSWLNDTLKLEPKITNIPKEFSNGYKFALILSILKEITSNELNDFKDSNNIDEIKSNFQKLQKHLHYKLNLAIREDEFNEVINKNISRSVVILYKIKNSIEKKRINFLDMKTSDDKPTKEELNKKINELMEDSTEEKNKGENNNKDNLDENKEKEKEKEITPRKEIYNKYTIRKMFDGKNDLSPIKSVSSGLNKNLKNNDIIKIKKIKTLNALSSNTNITDLNNNQELNTNTNVDNNRYANVKTMENNSIKRNKKLLPKIKLKKSIKYNFNFINNSNEKEVETDFYNDYGMNKIKELKLKLKLDEMKKQEKLKNKIKENKNNIFETKERYQLDFLKKLNNPLYKFSKSTGINISTRITDNYKSYTKRYEYAKEFAEMKKRNEINQQLISIRKSINLNLEEVKKSQKILLRPLPTPYSPKNSSTQFNKIQFLNEVDKINIVEYKSRKNEIYTHIKNIYPTIKNVVYSILDLTEEIYDYQDFNEKDIVDLEDFHKLFELFIADKLKKKVVQIIKSESIDNINNIRQLDPSSINFTEDEKYLIQDYINYIGNWDYKKIITEEEEKNIKFDIRKIKPDFPLDYEPTKNEIDDFTIPNKLNDNYLLGNSILNIIENKFNNINHNETAEINKEDKDNNTNNTINNKWDYIPYKLSLIGYPLSGRKLIAENLVKKYPNIKIYSIKKIFRDYYTQYKEITEKIEGNPKYINYKPNQIEQLKEERNKKLEEFTPIVNILKPFIDLINNEKKNKLGLNKNTIKSPRKSKRPSISKKSALNSPRKVPKNKIVQNEEVFIEENINEDLKKIPNDEILFNLLKYIIEKDFIKPSQEQREKEILEYQQKVNDIKKEIDNYEKQKLESNKPNPKNDSLITNLNQNLENMKSSSIKGFILVDYPTNINQSILLENYLTGYEDELQKPKTEKKIVLNKITNFFDYKIKPKENTTINKSGLDFVINLKINEKDIDQRFNSIKYDPITDTIYTDINEENNKLNLDKKIIERLVNEVPYLTKENFYFYKDEYNNNISAIKLLYNKFGMNIDNSNDIDDNEIDMNNINNINFNDKEIKKSFQQIEFDTFIEKKQIKEENNDKADETNKNIKINSPKKKEISSPKKGEKNENKKDLTKSDVDEKNLNKAINFITEEIINIIYKEKDKADKIFYNSKNIKNNNNENNNQEEKISTTKIRFDHEMAEEKRKKLNSSHHNISSKNFEIESIFILPMLKNIDYIINNISSFNIKYNNSIGKFIYFMNIQKNKIHQKLNNYQTSFRDYLNHKTKKKKLIHVFIKKYNEFFEKNNFFESDKAIKEFNQDIEEINNNLWLLIYEKEKNCIKELDNIKNEGFMQKELEKFYFNIKSLFLLETEKFIEIINQVIYLYSHLNLNNNKNNLELSNLIETQINKNDIFKDICDIKINGINIDELVLEILSNINIMFDNSIKIIFSYENIISKLIDEIKYMVMISSKKMTKKSTKNLALSTNTPSNHPSINIQPPHEKVFQIIQNEKNKYKYRILYLKNFSKKYISIITQTSHNIFNNLDQWIVTSISMQNDALNNIITIFKSKLNEKELIDEKKDINIEMDEFEKSEDDISEDKIEEITVKPIDNNSVISNKVYYRFNIDYLIKENLMEIKTEEIIVNNEKIYKIILPNELDGNNYKLNEKDFYFDIGKFNEIYLKVKKYEIEPNIISKDLFYEIFIKQYCIDIYNENNTDENKGENNDKSVNRSPKKRRTRTKKEIVTKEDEVTNLNNTNENLSTKTNITLNNLNGICNALRILNSKQQSKIYSLYKINIKYKNQNNKEENKTIENANEENKEYDIYLNTNEIFTILPLIGCKILNAIEEENIFKDLKDKIVSDKFLSKRDFMKYNFWFEKDLEYQNQIIKQEEMTSKKSRKNINKMNIKEFLFNLWKEDNENKMDFAKFMNILKVNRYMTDLNAFKEENYYNIIFQN